MNCNHWYAPRLIISVQFYPFYSAEELKLDFDLAMCYLATDNKSYLYVLNIITNIH
jgi:hypothetical protein